MKRGTIDHPKTLRLVRELDCEPLLAVGVLESLFQWTAKYAICGDIGKFPNRDIADGVKWRGDADKLIAALISSRWVDEHDDPAVRLVVHDWHDHADQSVQKTIKNKGLTFFSTFPEKDGKKRKRMERDGKGKPQPKPLAIANSQQPETGGKPPSGSDAPNQPDLALPPELDTPPCRQAVADWVEHRKQKRKPATKLSLEKLVKQWARIGPAAFVEAVDHSIANGWEGVHPPSKTGAARSPPVTPTDDDARRRKAAEENQARLKMLGKGMPADERS